VKVLVQNLLTGLYLGTSKKWLKNPEEALAFLNEIRARDYCIYHRLQQTAVVVVPETSRPNDEQPAPAIAKQPAENSDNADHMKAKTIRTSLEAKTEARASKTLETKAAPDQTVSETRLVKSKKTRKKIALESAPAQPAPNARPSLQPMTTTIEVKVDVGIGNELFIRGEGAGLSWDKGELLRCVDRSTWTWSTAKAQDRLVYKILVNDQVWSQGENLVAETGTKTEVVPAF